ncbi:hypothetical protein H2203_007105 [Taxawa tesnikishii (nom. ined.)]|nr:hypothetical protein H2203_007105 [Dothideales sp. JES 119]
MEDILNGKANSNGIHQEHDSSWVPVVEQPLFQPRRLKVICIGAGVSGLMVSYKHKYAPAVADYMDLIIYEKNHDVGGTWLNNTFPGVGCDVPAHIYTFPFAPNPNWSRFYVPGAEVWQYIKDTTSKYGLDETVRFNSKIIEAIWNNTDGKWDIKIEANGEIISDRADVLINSSGLLSRHRWPDIKGLESFQGKLTHSAAWDPELTWEGKRVAIIGNGASGIQILPQMPLHLTKSGRNFKYTEEEKQEFRDNPAKLTEVRKQIEHAFNSFYYALFKDSPAHKDIAAAVKKQMEDWLNRDPELCRKLIPEYDVGCRRLTPGESYLEALQEDNVSMQFGEILEITPTGIPTKGGIEEFHVIVCATGFDLSFRPPWIQVGKNGTDLATLWADEPESYMAICVPDMPNFFMFLGPGSPVGQGSTFAVLDCASDYVFRWIRKIATQGIKSASVSYSTVHDYNVYSQEILKRLVWSLHCRTWYKASRTDPSKVTSLYAGSVLHFREMLEEIRGEEFEIEYRSKNRFSFMGNGMTTYEVKDGIGKVDLAYYMRL